MKSAIRFVVAVLLMAATTVSAQAADYTTYLTAARGFTEVTSISGFTGDANDYYILVSAENTGLIVGIGAYEAKPDWASEETKALRYLSAATDPVLNLSNFFTIEKSGNYIGLRNVVYNTSFFQTHDNAGYMYVLTYTEPTLSDWCYLTPTFQNGYWLFESGKYPMSSGNWACGYLGPWNKTMAAGEPMALNRQNTTGDEAGHYRLFRIAKNELMTEWRRLYAAASASNMIDVTWAITNPSFELGDFRGWTFAAYDDKNAVIEPANYNDVVISSEYSMSNKDGNYLMNAYQWWCTSMNVSQTVSYLPSGEYELSAVVCTWEGRTVSFSGNTSTVTTTGINDQTGIPITLNSSVGNDQKLVIKAESTGQWWVSGHEGEIQTFYKFDNVQLKCKSLYLNALAQPLPNDDETLLLPDFWYYYNVDYPCEYQLIGNLMGMTYSTDDNTPIANITTADATRQMTLLKGRVYFKTTRSDATLSLHPARELNESGTFTAVALNVDGLPNKILTIELNADGPGSEGTKKISQYLASKGYDMIGCSEDFNYHGSLISAMQGNYSWGQERASLSASGLSLDMLINGFRFDTDGLNLLWKNSTMSAANESWTQWSHSESEDGNQYIKKGFRHYDMTLAGGEVIDVYVLHMDAGDVTSSREQQWRQMADVINAANATRPKLIIGDTNSRWTREDITTNFMNRLNSNLTASDVWVEFYRNGIYPTTDMADLTDQSTSTNYTNYEIVDKIIYINPKAANTVQLVPQSFRIEQDYTYDYVDHNGNTNPLGDHKPVVVEFKYVKSGDIVLTDISLADGADNTTSISNADGVLADVTLSGRTLYKDGSWNSLCLPFNMTADQVTAQLAPAALMELDTESTIEGHKTGLDGNTLYLNFKKATAITSGTPYIIKWDNENTTIDNPTFNGVTITAGDAGSVEFTGGQFLGTYGPVALPKDDRSNLFLGNENQLYWPNVDNYTVNAFRAYFKLSEPTSTSRFVLNFGDEASGISEIKNRKSVNSKWFDLQGRCLDSQPAKAGLYISNGKKVIVGR